MTLEPLAAEPEAAPALAVTPDDPFEVLISLALFEHAERVRIARFERPSPRSHLSTEERRATVWNRLMVRFSSVLPRRVSPHGRTVEPQSYALVGLPPALPLFIGGLVFAAILSHRRSRG